MKKNSFLILTIIFVTALNFAGCKKENTAKGHTALFNNTVWTGEFHYTGQPVQPVSIEFKQGGAFTWYDIQGDFPGSWKIENGQITISFPSGSIVKADISNDNKLINFQHSTGNGWAIDNAELNTTPDETIENTSWKTTNILLDFKASNKVNYTVGTLTYSDISYLRKAKFIRFSAGIWDYFIIINSSTVMTGVNQPKDDTIVYPFKLGKL